MPPTVFISYSSSDNAFAEELAASLKGAGYNVWFDRHEMTVAGQDYADRIVPALDESTHMVLLLSRAACTSTIVKGEFRTFDRPGKVVLPLVLPGEPTFQELRNEFDWVRLGLGSYTAIRVEDAPGAATQVETALTHGVVTAKSSGRATRPLSYVEIRARLHKFVHEYKDTHKENADSHDFWRDLFACYDVTTRGRVQFERPARRASTGGVGRIDVFWPGLLIGEQKSRGKIASAHDQAMDYLQGGDVTDNEMPRYVVCSDFATITITELTDDGSPPTTTTLALADLPKKPQVFAFLTGRQTTRFEDQAQAAASIEAARIMGRLYEELSGDIGPDGADDTVPDIAILLTRLLFLMFGDDALLWGEPNMFQRFVEDRTSPDGSDVGTQLNVLFRTLNKPVHDRSGKADPELLAFPYVNGHIFADSIDDIFFDSKMRDALLEACRFDWTAISPAVFGSLFQTIKSKQARREGGEHYTTEANILKVLRPLFLDELRAEFAAGWDQKRRLHALHDRLGKMQYLDPACGCGNFLVVAYREMRQLELDILVRLKELEGDTQSRTLDATWDLKVNLDQFHGIEIDWWPAKIAETAMFLVDHQANMRMQEALGGAPNRLPITMSADIWHANALTTDWSKVLTPTPDTYVFGNPPFLGHASRTEQQARELREVWGRDGISRLDYVTGWYALTLDYFSEVNGEWAFVSTNSITQGDPVPHLFAPIFEQGWRIKFAHRTFGWTSEASGKAAVHCVIIGFSRAPNVKPRLFDYATVTSEPDEIPAKTINAYLVDGPNVFVTKRMAPLSPGLPEATFGAMPRDDGNLIVEPEDYDAVMADPFAAKYVRRFVMGRELIHNTPRWCLWLTQLDPADVSKSPVLKARLDACGTFRAKSTASSTRAMAATPHLFGQRPPEQTGTYVGIPAVFSETRLWATCALLPLTVIAGNKVYTASDPTGFLFGVISSSMFITWQKTVGGRLESRPSFSNTIVWNNLPLPAVDDATRAKIIKAGQGVLDARNLHPDRSLAQHYNPLAMDPTLVKAHNVLDRVVDRAFGAKRTCTSERERQQILFARYQELLGVQASGPG